MPWQFDSIMKQKKLDGMEGKDRKFPLRAEGADQGLIFPPHL